MYRAHIYVSSVDALLFYCCFCFCFDFKHTTLPVVVDYIFSRNVRMWRDNRERSEWEYLWEYMNSHTHTHADSLSLSLSLAHSLTLSRFRLWKGHTATLRIKRVNRRKKNLKSDTEPEPEYQSVRSAAQWIASTTIVGKERNARVRYIRVYKWTCAHIDIVCVCVCVSVCCIYDNFVHTPDTLVLLLLNVSVEVFFCVLLVVFVVVIHRLCMNPEMLTSVLSIHM